MFGKFKERFSEKMNGITLSKGLDIVNDLKRRPGYEPTWYSPPIRMMIEMFGDIPVADVTPAMFHQWYEHLRKMPNKKTGEPLSPYTINRRARAVKAYFGHMIRMGHLEENPTEKLRLPRLPSTSKNAIGEEDVEELIRQARVNPRNLALVLILRDSGARAGEMASMRREYIKYERYYELEPPQLGRMPKIELLKDDEEPPDGFEAQWRGQAMVFGSKMSDVRWIYFKHEACLALMDYLERRVDDIPFVWLNNRNDGQLSGNGIYQMLENLAKRGDVETFNPHAFRHRLAKRLKEARVDPEIIARILGHADVQTYQRVYGLTTEEELKDYFTVFTRGI